MARCPHCSAWLWTIPESGANQVCPNCGATIGRADIGTKIGLVVVEAPIDFQASLTEDEAEEKWRRDHEDYYGRSSSPEAVETIKPQENMGTTPEVQVKRKEQAAWGRCRFCHAIIPFANSSYCSYCGARLQPGAIGTTLLRGEEQVPLNPAPEEAKDGEERCMVCNLGLKPDEDLVFCPYCGTVAHRAHLLRWIHERESCPICRATLNEESLRR